MSYNSTSYGEVQIQDSKIINNNKDINKFKKGLVRFSTVPVRSNNIETIDKISEESSSTKSNFTVDINCTSFVSKFSEGFVEKTNINISNNYKFTRLIKDNVKKEIKDFICPYAGKQQSAIFRKRLIALERIHETISNKIFHFKIH